MTRKGNKFFWLQQGAAWKLKEYMHHFIEGQTEVGKVVVILVKWNQSENQVELLNFYSLY
ncbi:hypothetical protein D0T87_11810 [Bacteroides sp. 51]|nr:hypothetical protein [Bacteroides sp. 51]